jgi:hypothetical protein
MITLNAIAKRLEEFGTNHFFIKSYSFGSPDDVDLDKFQDFPLMHVVYTGSDYEERTKTFSFEVYVFDRPNREEQMTINQREVVSDAQQCLEDVIADIANGGNIFLFDEDYEVTTAGITPLIDERSNLLTGALLDLTIQVPYQRDACNLPIDGVQSAGGEISYRRRGILRVRTQDGTTDVQSVNEIRVTNGTLTDEGDGVVSIDTGSATIDALDDIGDVNLDDPQDHEALVYDQDTATWINGASTKIGIRVINTGLPLLRGCPVRATGVQGDQVIVAHFNASQHDPKTFIGLLSENVNNGATGYARQTGTIYQLDTSAFEIGDILYPKGGVFFSNGFDSMTTDVPSAPDAKIPCAIVLRKHENTGRVYVRTWTPSRKIEDMDDVGPLILPQFRDGKSLVWNIDKWISGSPKLNMSELLDVQTYNPVTIPNKQTLRWSSLELEWQVIPEVGGLPTTPNVITYFLGRYNDEASTARQAADATLTIEHYLSVQADGHGEEISIQTDTPTSGNKIVRKIWHKAVSFEDSDVTTWTLVHTFADDTAYADTTATFNALLTAATYGSIPFTLAQTWEDVPAVSALLDGYTDDLALAIGPVLLVPDYTGDCMRIRRASDNAETDIGFDGIDLDTAAIATFCSGTNGFVKVWYNQDGSGNHATQTTTGSQPKIYDASTGVMLKNALPAIDFDGTDDDLLVGVDVRVFTSFSIASADDATNNAIFGDVSDAVEYLRYQNGVVVFRNSAELSIAVTETNQNLIYTLNDTTSEIGVNGGTVATSVSLGTDVFNLVIGNKRNFPAYMNGTIQAVIIYNADKSADRTAIETALNDYFNIY